jgi:hypothetical protein
MHYNRDGFRRFRAAFPPNYSLCELLPVQYQVENALQSSASRTVARVFRIARTGV